MIDCTTQKPLVVKTHEKVGPSVRLPMSQVEEVRRLLDSRGIKHEVEDQAISLNDGPYMTYIYFSREVNADAVQAVLDAGA